MSRLRVAVIGGGVAGLAAAHRLGELAREHRAEVEAVVFEGTNRLGGAIRTERVGDYLVEWGADMFITDKPWAASLCERLGLAERLIAPDETYRRSLVLGGGVPRNVPEGFLLMAPTEIVPMLTTPILSPQAKLRMALDLVLPRGGEGDESLGAFVRRRFGAELLDRLVQPLVGGIYTGDPERLSLRATLPRFVEMERRHRSLILAALAKKKAAGAGPVGSGARYNLFVSLPEGMEELLSALVGRLPPESLRRACAVSAVRPQADGYLVASAAGEEHFDAVVVALPAFAGARLLEGIDPALAGLLGRIPYASTLVVVSGHRLSDVSHPLDAFGLVVPHVERRSVLAVSFASRKFPGRAPAGRVLLRTFIGGALQPELAELTDARAEGVALAELGALLGVRGKPDFVTVVRHARAMPQYGVGHGELCDRIDSQLARHPRLALAGNAFRGVGIPDCVRSGEQAAERAFLALAKRLEAGEEGARARA